MTDTDTVQKTAAVRPIIAIADRPVSDNELMLDADDLADSPADDLAEWGRAQRVSEVQQAINSLEHVADNHTRRAIRAREAAQALRNTLHAAADATEQAKPVRG